MSYIFIVGSVRNLNIYNQRWGGAVATIEEEEGNEVWGVLWQVKSTRSGDGLILIFLEAAVDFNQGKRLF